LAEAALGTLACFALARRSLLSSSSPLLLSLLLLSDDGPLEPDALPPILEELSTGAFAAAPAPVAWTSGGGLVAGWLLLPWSSGPEADAAAGDKGDLSGGGARYC
jgi:hypothetical protein